METLDNLKDKDMRVRFVDHYIFADDAEFEAKHKRDEEGKFSKTESKQNTANENKKEQDENEKSESFEGSVKDFKVRAAAVYKEHLSMLENGENPSKVLRSAAQKLSGVILINRSVIKTGKVIIGEEFIRESCKYIANKKLTEGQKIEIAKKQLAGMSLIGDLLDQGQNTGWSHQSDHNPEKDFITFYKRFSYEGKNPVFAVDVFREHEDEESLHRAYNVTNEENRGFLKKANILKMRIEDSISKYEIVRVRVT